MKTVEEITKRLEAVDGDARYHYPSATIFENAPLALIQTQLETEARLLAWILDVDVPKQRRRVRGGKR